MQKLPQLASTRRTASRLALVALASIAAVSCDDATGSSKDVVGVKIVTQPLGAVTTNLLRGITVNMQATPFNADTAWVNTGVTWTSSNDARATVAPDAATNGRLATVTTVSGGEVWIYATANGVKDSIRLTIQYPVGTVTVTGNPTTIRREGAVQLTATLLGTDGQPAVGRTVTWTSSNPAVATVSATGFVSGLTDGTTTITATSEGVSGTRVITVAGAPLVATVTVTSPLGAMSGSGATATQIVGTGMTFTVSQTSRAASGTVIAGTTATWSSSAPTVASVDPATGQVTVLTTGSAVIRATVDNGEGTPIVGNFNITSLPGLQDGVQVTAPTITASEARAYAFYVPTGSTSVNFSTTAAGTGDVDVYVFAPGVVPSAINTSPSAFAYSNFTQASASSGNTESITIANPTAGVWRVHLYAWASPAGNTAWNATGVQLTADVSP